MYSQYWGLSETPFENAQDPDWYHEAPGHEEAVARLLFVAEQRRRCGLLTGPSGSGKSLVLAVVERELRRLPRQVVGVDLTSRSAEEFLFEVASGLRLAPRCQGSRADLWRQITDHIQTSAASRLPVVILLDHPEQGPAETTLAVRRLLNLPAGTGLSVLLATDPAAGGLAARMQGWADLRVELPPLDATQTRRYVTARLARAGASRGLFSEAALDALFEHSGGLPRDINRLGELSLVAASAFSDDEVDETVVHTVARELHALSRAEPLLAGRERQQQHSSRADPR